VNRMRLRLIVLTTGIALGLAAKLIVPLVLPLLPH
jgi:hypothetical protein